MVYKNYSLYIIVLTAFIVLFSVAAAFSLAAKWWISTVFFLILVGAAASQIISISKRIARKLRNYLDALKFEDYNIVSGSNDFQNKEYRDLNDSIAQISENFRRINSEKEKNLFYLQNIIEHIDIGILAFNLEGKIVLINKSLMTLFGIKSMDDVSGFEIISPELYSAFERINPHERRLVNFFYKENSFRLAIYATRFGFENEIIKLISIKNIRTELERQELDSWQKLISVLTHEIMNSIAPISSLSQTLNFMLSNIEMDDGEEDIVLEKDIFQDTKEALETIHKRSDGLIHFVQTYRNLAKVPKPVLELFSVASLFKNVHSIFKAELESAKIELIENIEPSDLELLADIRLIEQVMINLLKNAIQALKNIELPRIRLSALVNELGNIELQVEDNGQGILPEVLDKIFIPFFTTKTEGSGIGLSLSRQIINSHGGSLTAFSELGIKTIFRITI